MDRITSPGDQALQTAAASAHKPRRRWSDGPNYPWAPGAWDDWSIGAHWPALSALVAEEVGTRSASMLKALEAGGQDTAAAALAVAADAQALNNLARTLQGIVRLASGAVHPAAERIDLAQAVRMCVRQRQAEWARRDAQVSVELDAADVHLDPALALQVVNAAIDWALSFSRRVQLNVAREGGQARITLVAALAPVSRESSRAAQRRTTDNIYWIALRQLSALSRMRVTRGCRRGTETAVIEFERTYHTADGLCTIELLGDRPHEAARHWVLAIVPEKPLRELVLRSLLQYGLYCSVAADAEQARSLTVQHKPRVLVVFGDESASRALPQEWALEGHRSFLVHVSHKGQSLFGFHGASGAEQVWFGRADVAKELVAAVLVELARD